MLLDRSDIAGLMKKIVDMGGAYIDESGWKDNKSLSLLTNGGFSITLHNKGLRPTVYSVEPFFDRYGNANHLIFDTIVCEKREAHRMEKFKITLSVPPGTNMTIDDLPGVVFAKVKSFLNQTADGSHEETAKNFARFGLLYRKKTTTEEA